MSLDEAEGVLAIWHDVQAGREDDFEAWYRDEHFPERLAVPGFRIGRRFEAVEGAPRFFCHYFTDTPEVLTSGPYLARLDDPTPWTRAMMTGVFLNMNRTVCRRAYRRGNLTGGFAVTARLDAAPEQEQAGRILGGLASEPGIARAELWIAAEQGKGSAQEERLRGPDRKIAACAIVEAMRLSDAERTARRLTEAFGTAAEIGVYRLLCELQPANG